MAFALSVLGPQKQTKSNFSTTGPDDSTKQLTSSPTPTTSTTKAPPYKIFYDKKLSPEIKELLTQDQLHGVSFYELVGEDEDQFGLLVGRGFHVASHTHRTSQSTV